MAGSGRKPAVKIAISAAAVGVVTSVAGVAATQPASISSSLVDLAALIVVGSSTHPSGEGVEDFFGGKFDSPIYTDPMGTGERHIIHVNFQDGPAGIQAALDASNGERNAVVASGWGAANASLLLLRDNPSLGNTVFILDNDVARPDGGFGTRYPLFALIGVNPHPTPSDTSALRIVNTGYEYDYNSNAPAYVLNPFSAVNSLAGWLTNRLNQAEIDLPVDAEGRPMAPDGTPLECGGANTCAITEGRNVIACPDARCSSPGERITAYVTTRNNTTYVTYTSLELPLTTLIRGIFGDYIANVSAPLLKWAVDFGYYGGNPIPSDPSAYRPGRLLPSIGDIVTALVKLPGAILETVAAIFAPLVPRQAAPANTPMMTTQTLSTEQETRQGTEEGTDTLPAGEGTGERRRQETQEITSQELDNEPSTDEALDNEPPTDEALDNEEVDKGVNNEEVNNGEVNAEDTSRPLMNVLRNSLRAVPGQSFAKTNDDSDNDGATTNPESVETEQYSQPEETVAPADQGSAAPDADPGSGDDNHDSSDSGADAAA